MTTRRLRTASARVSSFLSLYQLLVLSRGSATAFRFFSFPTTGFQILLDASTNDNPHDVASSSVSWVDDRVADGWIVNSITPALQVTDKNYFVSLRESATEKDGLLSPDPAPSLCGFVATIEHRDRLRQRQQQQEEAKVTQGDISDLTWIWELSDHRSIDPQLVSTANEVYSLHGDFAFAMQSLHRIAPGSQVLWRPTEGWDVLDVWKFRSQGCRGLILDAAKLEAQGWNELYRKLKRPCSSMDYPPTIYMIGEDEIVS